MVLDIKLKELIAKLHEGDIATASKLLPEAYDVFEPLVEHYYMCWNLWLQAMIATQQDRPQDAIGLYARRVTACREIGYTRGTMVGLEGLGEANVAAGRFEAAERAFIEALATADKMGMVRDMLGLMAKIAKVRRSGGRPRRRSSCWQPSSQSRAALSSRSRPTRRSRTSLLRRSTASATPLAPTGTQQPLTGEHPLRSWSRRRS